MAARKTWTQGFGIGMVAVGLMKVALLILFGDEFVWTASPFGWPFALALLGLGSILCWIGFP